MAEPGFTPLDLRIVQTLWDRGAISIREIQEAFPQRDRPAYSTVQTTVYRMETKKAVRRVRKISNAHIFEAVVMRTATQRTFMDDLLRLFGGRSQPVMEHLIETGSHTGRRPAGREYLKQLARKERAK